MASTPVKGAQQIWQTLADRTSNRTSDFTDNRSNLSLESAAACRVCCQKDQTTASLTKAENSTASEISIRRIGQGQARQRPPRKSSKRELQELNKNRLKLSKRSNDLTCAQLKRRDEAANLHDRNGQTPPSTKMQTTQLIGLSQGAKQPSTASEAAANCELRKAPPIPTPFQKNVQVRFAFFFSPNFISAKLLRPHHSHSNSAMKKAQSK